MTAKTRRRPPHTQASTAPPERASEPKGQRPSSVVLLRPSKDDPSALLPAHARRRLQISTDSQPDYQSNYFTPSDPCHEVSTTAFPDPSLIAAESIVMSGRQLSGLGVIGVAINGVSIFSRQAAPGDDIYTEAGSFDQCQGHPNKTAYHYHTEPYSISDDDSNLVGVMRDGSCTYGRKDADGSTPLDSHGGHTGTTPDSATPVSHCHVNQQISTNRGTTGQSQCFLTKGSLKSAPGSCPGCGDMR